MNISAESEEDVKLANDYQPPLHQNNNDHQKTSAAHAALGMLAALAPMKLPRTVSPRDQKDINEDNKTPSPQTRDTIIPSDIATNPLAAMQYLKCTNESQQR